MREIVLDTETTGLDPFDGHRIVEIGCVELVNCIPTGRVWHCHLNPERDVPYAAFEVHGLSLEFLRDKPRFADVAEEMIAFFGDAVLVAHNAPFDMGFLNFELELVKRPPLRNTVVDTVAVARDKHPGAKISLDALCRHYGIDNSRRTLHGALLDSEILADVYLELIGGKQIAFALIDESRTTVAGALLVAHAAPQRPTPLPPRLEATQIAAHLALIRTMGEAALWGYYVEEAA